MGLPTVSISAGAPLAYEPPLIVTFAVVRVSTVRWKIEPILLYTAPVVGKSLSSATAASSPLTEMTAVVGGGGGGIFTTVGAAAFVGFGVDVPDEAATAVALTCALKGSLLAKRV